MQTTRCLARMLALNLAYLSLPIQAEQISQHKSHDFVRLSNLLTRKRYLDLEDALAAAKLSPANRAYFQGVLANRQNRLEKAIPLLESVSLKSYAELSAEQITTLLRTLADSYGKVFRYAEADKTYSRLLQLPDATMTADERGNIDGNRKFVHLLREAPPQTVRIDKPFRVPTTRNRLGTIETIVHVGTNRKSWILDTGANISLISETLASQLGLKLSNETAPVDGFGGASSQCHVAIIPELHVGDAELQNVAVLVMQDKDLYIPQLPFQINAILGYPVLAAMGRLSFDSTGYLEVNLKPARAAEGAQMFMEELTPIVSVAIRNTRYLFRFDTGAANSYLTSRYWEAHKETYSGRELIKREMAGSGGSRAVPAYMEKELNIKIGDVSTGLRDVPVLTQPHTSGEEYFYGHLGQDVISAHRSFSLDFRSMRLALKPQSGR
jgi:predicted aspartyl protease